MGYQYHCQHKAELTANSIMSVPDKYPLANGLPDGFIKNFSRLCGLVKDMYLDMAKRPETYGLVLADYALQSVDKKSKEHGLIMKSRNSVNRLPDTLFRLAQSGEARNHQLDISLPVFKESIKQTEPCLVNPVPRYEMVLSRLVDFGFVISDFNGKPFDKTLDSFTVEYPDAPELIDTLKAFCGLWFEDKVRQRQGSMKERSSLTYSGKPKPVLHYYNHMNFDFRFTADQDKIPMQKWIEYDLQSKGYVKEKIDFLVAFYDCSLQYPDVHYDGNYFYKSERITKVHDGFVLKLKNPDNYMDVISTMPKTISDRFAKNYCRRCDFQGATKEHCKFRWHWAYDGTPRAGCAHMCFAFPNEDATLVPHFWRLLELEYGFTKSCGVD